MTTELIWYERDKERRVKLEVDTYLSNGSLYIGMTAYDEYCDCHLPFVDLTVNTDASEGLDPEYAYVDTENLGYYALEFIESNNLGKRTGDVTCDGYFGQHTYPLVQFNMDEIAKHTI